MSISDIKAVIVQDRLTVYGGGERVVHQMSSCMDTTIVTGEFTQDSTYDFSHAEVITLNSNSFSEFARLRRWFPWEDYDVAIFSGNRPQFCLWKSLPIPSIRYCHSPTRVFWSLRDVEYRNSTLLGKILRLFVAPTYRHLDRNLASNHNLFLVNSHNIRSQVDRFYGLPSRVLYPPVETDKYRYESSGEYWLSVNRIVPKKRVKEQVEAFTGSEESLKIIGGFDDKFEQYGKSVQSMVSSIPNVELLGNVKEREMRELYAKCKGVIYIPFFEDFGIVPIEAMASGKPVIAAAEGGPLETIIQNKTGWLISPTTKNLNSTIRTDFDEVEMRENCMDEADKYDSTTFKQKLRQQVSGLLTDSPEPDN